MERSDNPLCGWKQLQGSPVVVILVFVGSLAIAWWHWIGLLIGGLVLAITARSLRRATGYGLVFGGLVLSTFGARLWTNGTLDEVVATKELVVVAIVLAFVLPVVMSLIRGVLPWNGKNAR